MVLIEWINTLTLAIRDPVFAALYWMFITILRLPFMDFGDLLGGLWNLL